MPASARGMHPDYWAEETVEVAVFTGDATVDITATTLQRTQGSPPSPLYQFKVTACAGANCNLRDAVTFQVVDIGLEEPSVRLGTG